MRMIKQELQAADAGGRVVEQLPRQADSSVPRHLLAAQQLSRQLSILQSDSARFLSDVFGQLEERLGLLLGDSPEGGL